MIIVTGGAGFIGSNIVRGLNALGHTNILVVDDMTDGVKFHNLVDCTISDYMDKDSFWEKIVARDPQFLAGNVEVVFHEGACAVTTEWDGKFMLNNNYECSKILLHHCLNEQIPFLYASSAAVYGAGNIFREDIAYEKPLNVYGYSKFLFDQYVRRLLPKITSQVIGLRYFNVYGPGENHKGSMASVILHFNKQLLKNDQINLFTGSDGFGDGEQRRDFIYVSDVVKANIWLWQNQSASGIYNLGTGQARSFNDVAKAVLSWHQRGSIGYVPFPDNLRGCYQSFTQADITGLRNLGYAEEFTSIEVGAKLYLDRLNCS